MRKFGVAAIAALCVIFPVSAGSQDSVGFVQPNIVPPYDTCRQDVTAAAEQASAAIKANMSKFGPAGFVNGLVSACRIVRESKWVLDKIPDCTEDSNYRDLLELQETYRKVARETQQKTGRQVWCD